jgi:hypothetical protein
MIINNCYLPGDQHMLVWFFYLSRSLVRWKKFQSYEHICLFMWLYNFISVSIFYLNNDYIFLFFVCFFFFWTLTVRNIFFYNWYNCRHWLKLKKNLWNWNNDYIEIIFHVCLYQLVPKRKRNQFCFLSRKFFKFFFSFKK